MNHAGSETGAPIHKHNPPLQFPGGCRSFGLVTIRNMLETCSCPPGGTNAAMPPISALKIDSRRRWPTELVGRILFGLFIAQWLLVWTRLLLDQRPFGPESWPEAVLLVLTTAATLVTLSHEIPWQNVFVASAIIALISSASQRLALLAGIRSALLMNTGASWPVPLVWLVAVLNARGVARLLLEHRRKSPVYGLQLIGLTVLLAGLFGFGLSSWDRSQTPDHLFRESWCAPLSLAFTALLTFIVATPWLIKKRPVEQPPEYQPLIIWLMLNVLFVTAALLVASRVLPLVLATANLLILVQCLTGAKRKPDRAS
jgi:hypothetical protein